MNYGTIPTNIFFEKKPKSLKRKQKRLNH